MADTSTISSLLERTRAATCPDRELARDVCQALMFDGHGHGCGGFCQAEANWQDTGKDGVIELLAAKLAAAPPREPSNV